MLYEWKKNTANGEWHLFPPFNEKGHDQRKSLCQEENLKYGAMLRNDNNPPIDQRCQQCQSIDQHDVRLVRKTKNEYSSAKIN